MKKILLLIFTLSILFGCTTIIKSKEDIQNIAVVHQQIMSGQAAIVIKSAPLNDTEILIVDHASNRYVAFVEKWKEEILKLKSTTPLFNDFLADYYELSEQYITVQNVIIKNWGKYTLPNQIVLLEYQAKANKLNENVDDLITAKNIYEAGVVAVKLGKVLAGALL